MSVYQGAYTDDFGHTNILSKLNVYILSTVYVAPEEEERFVEVTTSTLFDQIYLPQVFFDNTSTTLGFTCKIPNGTRTIRNVKVRINSTQLLYCPVPFPGSTPEFKTFFQQLRANARVLSARYQGEHVSAFNVGARLGIIPHG